MSKNRQGETSVRWPCALCGLEFALQSKYDEHCSGKKHRKRAAQLAQNSKQPQVANPPRVASPERASSPRTTASPSENGTQGRKRKETDSLMYPSSIAKLNERPPRQFDIIDLESIPFDPDEESEERPPKRARRDASNFIVIDEANSSQPTYAALNSNIKNSEPKSSLLPFKINSSNSRQPPINSEVVILSVPQRPPNKSNVVNLSDSEEKEPPVIHVRNINSKREERSASEDDKELDPYQMVLSGKNKQKPQATTTKPPSRHFKTKIETNIGKSQKNSPKKPEPEKTIQLDAEEESSQRSSNDPMDEDSPRSFGLDPNAPQFTPPSSKNHEKKTVPLEFISLTSPLRVDASSEAVDENESDADIDLITRFQNERPQGLPIWASRDYSSPRTALHNEILDFCEYMTPTPAERQLRYDMIMSLTSVVQSIWKGAQVEVFGSYVSDLYLPTSDIDCVVNGAGDRIPDCLFKLAKVIQGLGVADNIEVISTARVPIVKFVDRVSGIQVDISFDASSGPANTLIVKSLLAEYPMMKNLLIVLKSFLQQRMLNIPYTGGVGSYALVLMTTSFLQQFFTKAAGSRMLNNNNKNGFEAYDVNYGILLIEFMRFYGKEFNYFTTGISVREGGCYFDKAQRNMFDPSRPYLICLEDPHDETNDVGRSSFKILVVRRAFEHAYARLFEQGEQSTPGTILSRIINDDEALLKHRLYVASMYPNLENPLLEQMQSQIDRKKAEEAETAAEEERRMKHQRNRLKKLKKKEKKERLSQLNNANNRTQNDSSNDDDRNDHRHNNDDRHRNERRSHDYRNSDRQSHGRQSHSDRNRSNRSERRSHADSATSWRNPRNVPESDTRESPRYAERPSYHAPTPPLAFPPPLAPAPPLAPFPISMPIPTMYAPPMPAQHPIQPIYASVDPNSQHLNPYDPRPNIAPRHDDNLGYAPPNFDHGDRVERTRGGHRSRGRGSVGRRR